MSRARAKELIATGLAAVKAADLPAARALFQQAVEIDPNYPDVWIWSAGVAETPAHAVRALEHALNLAPENARAKTALRVARFDAGVAAAKANQRNEARDYLRLVCADDAGNEAAWLWLAGATDDAHEAVACLERALELNPTNLRAKAGLESFQARLRAAAQWFCPICQGTANERFAICPHCKALLDLGQGHAALGNPCPDIEKIGRGASRLARAVREKTDFFGHYYLGMALLNLRRPDEAADHFRAARAIRPNDRLLASQVAQLEQALAESPRATRRLPPAARESTGSDSLRSPDSIRSIFVVDDSPTVRKLVHLTMRKNGYHVVEAGDGIEALELIASEGRPDLFVLDVSMPGMDGFSLCRAIRDNPATAGIPVIMLTGRDGFLDRMRGRLAGSDQYLLKPFQPDSLVRVVREFCSAGAAGAANAG